MPTRLPALEDPMRPIITIAALLCFPAAALAQSPRAYVDLSGGFAVTSDTTSGDVLGEAGVRVAPNLFVFGDLGRFANLQPSLFQPTVDATATTLSTGGLSVNGVASVPAWYSMGGLRYAIPTGSRVSPYFFGGAGFARVSQTATFTYSSGTLPGSTPNVGDDVTSQLVSIGDFVQPASTTSMMVAFGGGVEAPVAPHLVFDVGYRVAHVSTDTPINAQSVTFGFGYKF
jgi:opacity protein-like surface antigen